MTSSRPQSIRALSEMSETQDTEAQGIPLVQCATNNTSANASPTTEAPSTANSDLPPLILNGGPSSTNPSDRNGSAAKRGPSFVKREPAVRSNQWPTEVDIIAIPAIYGDPEQTWTPRAKYFPDALEAPPKPNPVQKSFLEMSDISAAYPKNIKRASTSRSGHHKPEPAWILNGIRSQKQLQKARVLLYDHGSPDSEHTLKGLAIQLLRTIEQLRATEKDERPLFFVCHSTGGLIAKLALIEARSCKSSVFGHCYGVSFFATPHRGSSYLSNPNYSARIAEIMNLGGLMPRKIAKALLLDNQVLNLIDTSFKLLATDMQIWSFFETVDTDLTDPQSEDKEAKFAFHAPITSIKSALLNLRHEVVFPLISDHAHCGTFEDNEQTKRSYLAELAHAVRKAIELSKTAHTTLQLEKHVRVEIIGFYESTPFIYGTEVPIRLWSTGRSLSDFKRYGPAALLAERLAENEAPPIEAQHLRRHTRAASLLPGKPVDSDKAIKFNVDPFGASGQNSSLLIPGGSGKRARRNKSKERPAAKQRATTSDILRLQQEIDEDNEPRPGRPEDNAPMQGKSKKLENKGLGLTTDFKGTPLIVEPERGGSISISGMNQPRRHSESPVGRHLLTPGTLPRTSSPRGRRGSERAALDTDSVPIFKPDIKNQKLVWVHVPYNNPSWANDILETISVEKGPSHHEKLMSTEFWKSKHVRGRHAEHHACFVKPGCSFISPETMSPSQSPPASRRSSPHNKPTQMCLFLPFLHFDTYKSLVKRRALIKSRLKQGRARPIPKKIAALDSLELKILWQFLGHDPPVNSRRTLDQFGYPGLLDTRARDDDQMLYKMTKQRCNHPHDSMYTYATEKEHEESEHQEGTGDSPAGSVAEPDSDDSGSESDDEPENDVLDGNVLMVDQVWLWVMDNETAVSFFSKREALSTDGRLYQQADLRNSVFNEVNADLTARCENSWDLAALLALHAVTVLFERSSHPDLEIFRIFEEAISILTEKMTNSFKRFRALGFRDKAIDHDDAVRTTNIRAKHKLEGELAEKQNRENTSALLELRDIEDELKTLAKLFEIQAKAIQDMTTHYKSNELKHLTHNGLPFLEQAAEKLQEYTSQTEKMIKHVQSTREDFDKLLQMVQRQAQVDEVRLSRLQADLASAQSRSVMIFTTFTVIFLPLTFFTGLFGMNTREWGGGTFLHLRTIGIISIPASFTIITLALIVAWSTRMRKLFSTTHKFFNSLILNSKTWVVETIRNLNLKAIKDIDARKKSMEVKKEKRRRKEAKRQATFLDEDFWEGHTLGREKAYQVPLQNRRSIREERVRMMKGMGSGERGTLR